ncbi:RNA 2',3'-cyclic phosphodiesterase [Sphingomonas panni]
MHRLFIALRPPLPMRRKLLDIMDGVEGARWQDDEQLHLTIRYVGAVERPIAEDIAVALQAVHAPALDLALAGVGRFDTGSRGRALWAGVTPHDAVAALHRKVDHALVRAGLPPKVARSCRTSPLPGSTGRRGRSTPSSPRTPR